jgi:tetratricopeptide (TPR) repeat protein
VPEEIPTSLTSEVEAPSLVEAEVELPLEEVEVELDVEEAPMEKVGADALPSLEQDEIEISEDFAVSEEFEIPEELEVAEELEVPEEFEITEDHEVADDGAVSEDPAVVGVEEEVFDLEDDATEFMSEPAMAAGFGEGEMDLDLPPSEALPAEEEILQDQPEIASETMPEFVEELDESYPVEEQMENLPTEVLETTVKTEAVPAGSDFDEPAEAELSASSSPELVEVDEYIALGLYEDARDTLRELLRANPEDQGILAKIEELGFSVSQLQEEAESEGEAVHSHEGPGQVASHPIGFQQPADTAASAESPLTEEPSASVEGFGEPAGGEAGTDSYVDLAAELSQEIFATQSAVEEEPDAAPGTITDPGLDEIFREFKKGVEKQLGTEDYDTRYNLGIAYKEMGLLDEAIAEFQLASKDETRLLECCSMLGLCFLEKGMPEIAIKWFEKGLGAPGRRDEEYHGLRYDLAQAHEAAGSTERALEIYMDIYRVNARFRDVRERVRGLQAAQS